MKHKTTKFRLFLGFEVVEKQLDFFTTNYKRSYYSALKDNCVSFVLHTFVSLKGAVLTLKAKVTHLHCWYSFAKAGMKTL